MSLSTHPAGTATPGTEGVIPPRVSFDAHPDSYRHWRLELAGEVARLVLDVDEAGGLVPGYPLKLNSYDLGVDIEL
jgi:benzoyl-CoA-dihydrodiol lyase